MINFSKETEAQFADRFLGAWRAIVHTSHLSRHHFVAVEDVVRNAIARQDAPDSAEFLRRIRHIVGPGINGSRLLTEIDDFLLSIIGRDFTLWRVDAEGVPLPDDFNLFRVSPSRVAAVSADQADAVETRTPLEEIAAAWYAIVGTGKQTISAVFKSSKDEHAHDIDRLMEAFCGVTTPAHHKTEASLAGAASKFLSAHLGEAIMVEVDRDRAWQMMFAREQTRASGWAYRLAPFVERARVHDPVRIEVPPVAEAGPCVLPVSQAESCKNSCAVSAAPDDMPIETTGPLIVFALRENCDE